MCVRSLQGSTQELPGDGIFEWNPHKSRQVDLGSGRLLLADLLAISTEKSNCAPERTSLQHCSESCLFDDVIDRSHCWNQAQRRREVSSGLYLRGGGPKKAGGGKVKRHVYLASLENT